MIWQAMDTAPKDGTEIYAEIPGNGCENIILWDQGFLDSEGNDCGCWIISDPEQDFPACWDDGVCWNEAMVYKPCPNRAVTGL